MASLYPMLIRPTFDERLWGGNRLPTQLGKDVPADKPIGESWEVYERNTVINGPYAGRTIGELRAVMGADLMGHVDAGRIFPMLTKIIDAHDVLSVQVHPDDAFARQLEGEPNGKTECWYVLAADPASVLTYGFTRDSSPDEYEEMVKTGTLDSILRSLTVQAGDVVYIPAGTVHAIGAGILLYELQQTSDITYRIYDWNRKDSSGKPRELHVDKARKVLNYHRETRGTVHVLHRPGSGRTMLIGGDYFCEELIEAGVAGAIETQGSPVVICALDRPVSVQAGGEVVALDRYSSLLVPAAAGSYALEPAATAHGPAAILASYVPSSRLSIVNDLRDRGFSRDEVSLFLDQFVPLTDLGHAPS